MMQHLWSHLLYHSNILNLLIKAFIRHMRGNDSLVITSNDKVSRGNVSLLSIQLYAIISNAQRQITKKVTNTKKQLCYEEVYLYSKHITRFTLQLILLILICISYTLTIKVQRKRLKLLRQESKQMSLQRLFSSQLYTACFYCLLF